MSAEDTFKADTETLLGLATQHWEVPEFQREFVWKDRQVNTLLLDINDAWTQTGDDYFLGAIVWFPQEDGPRAVIDGQQRLTTLFILIAALRDRVKSLKLHETGEEGQELLGDLDRFLRDKLIVKGQNQGRRNRITLRYSALNGTLEEIRAGQGLTLTLPQRDLSRRRMIRAYQLVAAYIEKLEDDLSALQGFFDWIGSSLLFVSVRAKDITAAYKVFETLNDRGQTLNAADLLKNLLFFKAQGDKVAQQSINSKWAEMETYLQEAPETSKVRFLRYFIVANHNLGEAGNDTGIEAKMVVASDLFDWIRGHPKELGTSKPVDLAQKLADHALVYQRLVRGRRPDGRPMEALIGIAEQGTGVRQHLAPLLAARGLPSAAFDDLCQALETLTFVLAVTRQPWNQLESRLPRWCARLREAPKGRTDEAQGAVKSFVTEEISPWLEQSGDAFWRAFARTDKIRDSLVRYALVEVESEIRKLAKDKNEIPSNRTVEHIFPQGPTPQNFTDYFGGEIPGGDDVDGLVKGVTYALGNLALLTTTENSVADRNVYAVKRAGSYAHTAFRLTKHLAVDMSIGKNSAINSVIQEFDLTPVSVWNAAALDKRAQALRRLMLARWPLLPLPASQLP
jgi:Protein of unknown function DUF262/Protein of unknown function (DUF1524)